MANDKELQAMADDMSKALEQETDAPRLSIDPKNQKPAVVGDPTALPEKKGTYTLTFAYPPEEVSEEDKLRMKKHAKTGYYTASVTYNNIFIKPLHRAKIAEIMTQVLADANVIDLDGYTTKVQTEMFGSAFLKHNDAICEVIKLMLKVPEEQLEYLMPLEPGKFVVQLFQNEPNLIKEANNFFILIFELAKKKKDGRLEERREFDALLGIWHSMAYFVAKTLKMRPYEILTEWTCEELLVTYGVYANQQSKEAYDMKNQKQRIKENLTYLDRWALPFFTKRDLEDNAPEEEEQIDDEMAKIADALFS